MGKAKPFHISYLNNDLERRCRDNANYSLRSYAKSLNVDPSLLSKILSRKQVLSTKLGKTIVESLNLDEETRRKFIESIGDEQKCRTIKRIDGKLTDCSND